MLLNIVIATFCALMRLYVKSNWPVASDDEKGSLRIIIYRVDCIGRVGIEKIPVAHYKRFFGAEGIKTFQNTG
jgi:hypothetical protein